MSKTTKSTGSSGVRAADQTVLSVPMSKDLKAEIEKLAEQDGRTTAAFVRIYLAGVVEAETKGEYTVKTIKIQHGPAQSSHGGKSASG